MKVIFLTFVFLFSSTSIFSQQLPTWYRVYTFDESIIEMNTKLVTFISKDISRVRFRWILNQPEALNGEPKVKYKSRLEVIEFNCAEQRYRPYHLTFLDATGNIVRVEEMNPPGEWLTAGGMMEKLLKPACQLVKQRTTPPAVSRDAIVLEKVARYAFSFSQRLERAKDLKPLIKKFFAADYLDGYVTDQSTNWFFNLNRETASKATSAELQRFYVALMNSGYLSSVYLMSQSSYAADSSILEVKLMPRDVFELIDKHQYTAKYKGKQSNYDYLAEKVDSLERLRSYTDLLESLGALMRRHVIRARAEHSKKFREMFDEWDLFQPKMRVCNRDCLGLPRGTTLFEVNVPVFRLQVAEINGKLRIVSATDYFH